MCDYSLDHVASRSAQIADRLVSTWFSNTITRGFATADDVNTVVCLRSGTEIAFDRPVAYEHQVTHATVRTATTTARFRQIDIQELRTHHDALEFADGVIVLLTKLLPGQHATVLQLPANEKKAKEGAPDATAALRMLGLVF
jgi:hypothetical protein